MEYLKSHPWIRFLLDLPRDQYQLWLRLGEISSKVEHLSGVPLRPDVAEKLNKIYLAKGVLATTAIEGNTLNEEQVLLQVEGKLKLPASQHYLQVEVQNILDVCNREAQALLDGSSEHVELSVDLIKSYNRSILHNLALDEGVVPGEIRPHSVVVGSVYRGAPARDCEYLLERLCEWLNGPDFEAPDKELIIPFALIKAIVAHIYLAWIHPFGDGNGRTARLVEFHILMASGVPLPVAHLMSDHYNLTRTQYYRELAATSKSGGDIVPFISYALQGFLDGARQQIQVVRGQQMQVAWENYVHDRFRVFKSSTTHKRRRDVVLELSRHDWMETSRIELLTPEITREYAAAGGRMVQRDLNAIAELGLIDRKHGKVRAKKELIQAFLPARVIKEDL